MSDEEDDACAGGLEKYGFDPKTARRTLPPGNYQPAVFFTKSFGSMKEVSAAVKALAQTDVDYAMGGPVVVVTMPAGEDMAGPRRYACIPKHVLMRLVNTTPEDIARGGGKIPTQ